MKNISMSVVAAVAIAVGSGVFAAQQMPRDPRPGDPRPATKQEADLQKTIAASPNDTRAMLELAKLQESRGARADAEATLLKVKQLEPSNVAVYRALAALYNRAGNFDRAVETLEAAANLEPANPEGYHLVATYYFEKASKDQTLGAAEKMKYIQRGLAAEDHALASRPEYMEALVYKNLLLRTQATLETDPARQQALVSEADALRNRALELRKNAPSQPPASGGGLAAPPPPPPPPPPPKCCNP